MTDIIILYAEREGIFRAKKIKHEECCWNSRNGKVECGCTGGLGTWVADEDRLVCGGSGI